jgi:hypothetical protein
VQLEVNLTRKSDTKNGARVPVENYTLTGGVFTSKLMCALAVSCMKLCVLLVFCLTVLPAFVLDILK